MRVSVVLPAYNAAGHLREALESLARQTEPEFETILIDDGSTDDTAGVAKGFAERDKRFRLVGTPHRGLVAALECGLSLARGRYVARMDADDVAHPERLRRQADRVDSCPDLGLAACLVEHLGDRQTSEGLARWVDWTNSLVSPDQIALHRFVESPLVHPSVMFRREIVERLGGYREGPFPEDYELWLRWLEAGVRMAKVPEELLSWRERPERLTRIDPRYSVESFYRVKAPYLARWLERHNPHHPEVVVWGAGRVSRLRLRFLEAEGVRVSAFVDIDPDKIGQRIGRAPVLGPDALPPPGERFVLQWAAARGARELVGAALQQRGYRMGLDWLPCG